MTRQMFSFGFVFPFFALSFSWFSVKRSKHKLIHDKSCIDHSLMSSRSFGNCIYEAISGTVFQ